MMRKTTLPTLGCLLAAAIMGCSRQSTPTGAPAATAQRPAPASRALSHAMVGAVPANKPSAVPVQVRFNLHARPTVAEPLDVGLALVPTSAAIDRISGKIVSEDGLDLVGAADIGAADRPAEGIPVERVVRLLPRRDGIFSFNAVITVDSGATTTTETFSIPVIVGSGITEASPAATGSAQSGAPVAGR